MKKFGLVALFTIAIGSSFAQTPATALTDKVKLNGSFRLRSEASDQTDFASRRNFNLMRFRGGVDIKSNDDTNVFIQPQFSKTFGEHSYVGSTTAANTFQTSSGTTYDTGMLVHQGYVNYHPNGVYNVTAGRQVLGFGDELVIGGLDWHNVSRSFDAVKVNVKQDKFTSDFFGAKVIDLNTASTGPTIHKSQGDKSLYGLYNTFSLGEFAKTFDAYGFYQKDETYSATTTDMVMYGIRAVSKYERFDYRTELSGQDGSGAGHSLKNAHQVDLEFGYTLDNSIKSRFAIEGFQAAKKYDQMYPTVHKWLGIADVLGRRNLKGYAFHASQQWSDVFSTSLDYHYFERYNVSESAFKLGGTALGTAAGSPSKKIGQEVDVLLNYKVSPQMKLSGGGGWFKSGRYLRDQFSKKEPMFSYAQLETSF